jgi:hypothetical protein
MVNWNVFFDGAGHTLTHTTTMEEFRNLCVMAVGPADVGKTSCLQKWLTAALEKGDTTLFVNCDVSSGTVPGCVSAFLNGASTPCAMYG